ncbi:MAG: hypothetical protein BWY36_00265 [Candidatus Diapherotrites archaeon ADurb.Bin253]|jgi:hypothetical protein|nr:MAG: hypothetical protein BWY36_00265 [Candidatus Diapherotrites archaeon ADurb.Bin253]HPX74547.1 hypothetical protein [Candidatus Pacearchaeota archaeon]
MSFEPLYKDVDYKILEEIDRIMKDIHQDYIIKSYHSWIEAENCYVYQNLN